VNVGRAALWFYAAGLGCFLAVWIYTMQICRISNAVCLGGLSELGLWDVRRDPLFSVGRLFTLCMSYVVLR
jgi:hypothetical protein